MTKTLIIRSPEGEEMHFMDFAQIWDGSFYWLSTANSEDMYLAISRREKLWNLYPHYEHPEYVVYKEHE
jgi:hypothetical protein